MTAFLLVGYPVSGIRNPEKLETLSHSVDISSVMLIKFATKYFIETKKLSFLLVILFASLNLFSQTKTNLDVFYSLTDSLVDQINFEIPSSEKKILLTLNLGQSYSLFSNSIKERFTRSGKEILEQPPDELNIPQVDMARCSEMAGSELTTFSVTQQFLVTTFRLFLKAERENLKSHESTQ